MAKRCGVSASEPHLRVSQHKRHRHTGLGQLSRLLGVSLVPVRVEAFVTICELTLDTTTGIGLPLDDKEETPPPGTRCFHLIELAELSDGRRVALRADRGFSDGDYRIAYPKIKGVRKQSFQEKIRPILDPPIKRLFDLTNTWSFTTRQDLTKTVLGYLEPDDDESWLQWVSERLSKYGVNVEIADIQSVPQQVEFGPTLDRVLSQRGL